MSTVKNTSRENDDRARTASAPRLSLSSARWGTRPSAPRLVTFSWGAVAPRGTRR